MAYIFDQSVFLENEISENIRSKARKLNCGKAGTVFREGDEEGGLIQIVEGIGEVQMPTVDGEVILTHLLWPGDWIGEDLLLTGEPRNRYLVARTDLVYLHLPSPDLLRVLHDDPEGWKAIGRMAHLHEQVAMRSYLDASIRDPAIRCLATLIRLGGHALNRPLQEFFAQHSGKPRRTGPDDQPLPQFHRQGAAPSGRGRSGSRLLSQASNSLDAEGLRQAGKNGQLIGRIAAFCALPIRRLD